SKGANSMSLGCYTERRGRRKLPKTKIAVIGASGMVGAALCERLFFDGEFEPVAVLHSAGKSARIARFPIQIRVGDLLDPKQVLEAISGCEYIVNCSRDGVGVMINGLKNLLHAARKTGAGAVIHLSSAAIYGGVFSGEINESMQPQPEDEYATIKL